MNINPTVRKILIISIKNAVRAVLTNAGAWGIDPDHFNIVTVQGLKHSGLLALSAMAAAEIAIWVPKVLAWANSPTNGN